MKNSFASNSGERHVSLFVPELLSGTQFLKDIPKSEIPKLPALQLLLSRATQKQSRFNDFYQGACVLSGVAIPSQQDLPLAAIAVAVDKELTSISNSEYYIFAEPVVMRADRDSVVLLESLRPNISQNSLSVSESEELITEINEHFIDEPWTLNLTEQGDWYFILNSKTSITTTNISTVLLQDARKYLPAGNDAQYWRKINNEIEMLLFASKVNEERVENNKPAVVSLWLYGGGQIPKVNSSDKSSLIIGDDIFFKSLSNFVNIPHENIMSTEQLFSKDVDHIIIANTSLKNCWQQRDLYSWIDTIKELELTLFEPLLKNIRNGTINTLTLYYNDKTSFSITRRNTKHWWKQVKSFESFSSLI